MDRVVINGIERPQGCYPNLSNDCYHSDPAISRSGIMLFKESPFKFWAHYLNPDRPARESTKAMDFGSAFHTFMIEPDKFNDEYITEPEYLKPPTRVLLRDVGRPLFEAYKAEKAKIELFNEAAEEEFIDKSIGKKIISFEDLGELHRMRIAIAQCKYEEYTALDLILNAKYEQSYFWQDADSGLMLKSRPDILHLNMIVDLKTCVSASTKAYQRAMVEGGLHIQGAMIQEAVRVVEGRDIPNVLNVCVEKSYPYCVGIKIISEDALRAGHEEFKAILMQMKKCFETNFWPSYEPETVELPKWAI